MAKQVGPQERKPEFLPVLRARDGDEDVLGEFHQGPQIEIQSAIRPDIRLQPIPILPKHEILLAKPGGVHIRIMESWNHTVEN
ncbi:hypothetical protein SAMN05421754_11143 [Nitrosomonas sp. Nm58]|nr:hypothetical protein SAMN05421754_11143 [Nitrosomonas sp. Nm58]